MKVKVVTLKSGLVVKVSDDAGKKMVYNADTGEYLTMAFRFKSRWSNPECWKKYDSMIQAIESGVSSRECKKALGVK